MISPSVDVIIPVLNAASTLEAAVESIQAQSYRAIRIVLIDDGSTDETPLLLAKIAARDSRVVVIRQENSGIVDALNRGWRSCDSPLIARHDADDIAAPDRLAKQVSFLEKYPDVIAVSGAFRHINLAGETTREIVRLPAPSMADPKWIPAREPYLLHPFLMLRRAAMEEIGGYRYVFHAEDADLYWRLQERGKLANLNDVLGDYRVSPLSISSRSVVNGRIQSLSSQLAAISAVRRRSSFPDIMFPRDALRAYQHTATLAELVEKASAQLNSDEKEYLAIATSEKLMQLSRFRPYELQLSDCLFISASYGDANHILSPENKRDIAARLSGAAARLILDGNFKIGFAICPPNLYLRMALRVLGQFLLPSTAWKTVRRLFRKTGA